MYTYILIDIPHQKCFCSFVFIQTTIITLLYSNLYSPLTTHVFSHISCYTVVLHVCVWILIHKLACTNPCMFSPVFDCNACSQMLSLNACVCLCMSHLCSERSVSVFGHSQWQSDISGLQRCRWTAVWSSWAQREYSSTETLPFTS